MTSDNNGSVAYAANPGNVKISIVTATFNSGRTVGDTLKSVNNQTYGNYEHLIVDGGSTDDTRSIVYSYIERPDERVVWSSEKDNGIYDAMNKGICQASGDVIGILNSDDFYYDEYVLESIAEAFNNDPELMCVYGNLVFVDQNDTTDVKRTWIGSQYETDGFKKGWHPAHPTFYARKKCFERFGGFDLSFDVSADFELMLRFIEKNGCKSLYLPKFLVKMRMGGESTGSVSKIIQGNKNVLRAFDKNGIKRPHFYLLRRLAPKAWNMIKTKLTR